MLVQRVLLSMGIGAKANAMRRGIADMLVIRSELILPILSTIRSAIIAPAIAATPLTIYAKATSPAFSPRTSLRKGAT